MVPRQHTVDRAQLRTVYREPFPGALDKVIDHVDDGAAGFIAASPFVVLATAAAGRADSSPRGGPPGFVRVLDEHHLAWGDLTGNNRLDSLSNVLEQPAIGLLLMVPGVEATLRIRGSAALVRDPEVLEACAIDGRLPRTAVVVTVRECYLHCGAAVRRSGLWDRAMWPAPGTAPSAGAILQGHSRSERSPEEIDAGLEHHYEHNLWIAGGRQE